jgi:hypothetical protein
VRVPHYEQAAANNRGKGVDSSNFSPYLTRLTTANCPDISYSSWLERVKGIEPNFDSYRGFICFLDCTNVLRNHWTSMDVLTIV